MAKKKKPTEKQPIFTRGYDGVREKLEKKSKYTMSCFNCEYYYLASGDKEEVCQNSEVLEYDMIISGNAIYCLRWKTISHSKKTVAKEDEDLNSIASLFKRRRENG